MKKFLMGVSSGIVIGVFICVFFVYLQTRPDCSIPNNTAKFEVKPMYGMPTHGKFLAWSSSGTFVVFDMDNGTFKTTGGDSGIVNATVDENSIINYTFMDGDEKVGATIVPFSLYTGQKDNSCS